MRELDQTVKYKDWDCKVGISHYNSNPNRPAIVLNDANTGEPIAALTKNIDELDYHPGEVIIDVNNCGIEAVTCLMDAGIIGPQTDTIRCGFFCSYPVHKLLI